MSGKTPKDEKDEILELIRVIDHYKCDLFKWYDVFLGMLPILIAVIISYILIEPVLAFGAMSSIERILGALSFLTLIVAIFAFVTPFMKGDIIRINFDRILKKSNFGEEQKPFLKALIIIKSENHEFELEQLYNEDKEKAIFSKQKLIEKLCKS
jgi:predicted PurR-regulated permease PerM